ncbi:Cytochrome c oxidase-assembly factor COX23, mitochondrial [Erysiphe neolycopersici]|uniref:Cytochrome c oxidase-assembly factor COX23, mitochondrial n=1 Tax=Erysiphe neolycopersici TaxID=212602 RepID=A0A420I143_9PEZI|nr:Cytochrome c oxidase-assembly factor COX23, mitochondrial [Erysiphe neolycopersici]
MKGDLICSSSKRPGEYMDPCQEAASRSMKCLRRNGGDREMCTDYFQTYRDCKKQWVSPDIYAYQIDFPFLVKGKSHYHTLCQKKLA